MSNTLGWNRRLRKLFRALTQIELVMILASIGLGGTVLLPRLENETRSRDEAVCLSNLQQIAAASWQYAAEDAREQLVPLHRSMVRVSSSAGFSNDPSGVSWSSRIAQPLSYGGQTPTVPFPGGCGNTMMSPAEGGNGVWVTETRPLDKYVDAGGNGGISPDPQVMEVFHCPADAGFPADPNGIVQCPSEAWGIPLYDMIGNSYRINSIGIVVTPNNGSFGSAPWGHTASSIASPLSETVLYAEPIFYNNVRAAYNGQPPAFFGWHHQFMSDQVAYCDGSARMTRADPMHEFTQEELAETNYAMSFPASAFLARGPTWRFDTYPTPGGFVRMFTDDGVPVGGEGGSFSTWPFADYQYNLPPE